jgi:uncharacterized Zn finger protein
MGKKSEQLKIGPGLILSLRLLRSYQAACQYLLKTRDLYENLGEQETWTKYITELRDKNRALRAFKEELANAGL